SGQVSFKYAQLSATLGQDSFADSGHEDILVRKVDHNGVPVWSAALGLNPGANPVEATAVAADDNGDVLVVVAIGALSGYTDGKLYKLNGNTGAVLWNSALYGSLRTVAADAAGNVYVMGNDPAHPEVATLAKYTPAGALLWKTNVGSPNNPSDP